MYPSYFVGEPVFSSTVLAESIAPKEFVLLVMIPQEPTLNLRKKLLQMKKG